MDPIKKDVEGEKTLTSDKLQEAYEEFTKDLPQEAVKSGTLEDGTVLTMYGYQFAVNVLNEVLGMDHWYLEVEHQSAIIDKDKNKYQATVFVHLKLGNWDNGNFSVIAQKDSYGHGENEQRGNALKGAVTNGFKKAAAMFGIGKKAYEGLMEDFDIDELNNPKPKEARVTKVGKENVGPLSTEDLEGTKNIEIKLLNVKSKEDLEAAKKEYDNVKGSLSEKQVEYLDRIVAKLDKKFNK